MNQAFLMEIESETANTRRLISNIEDKHLGWKPHDKSMSVGVLVGHIVELHNWVNKSLEVDVFNLSEDYKPFSPVSIKEAIDVLDSNFENNKRLIAEMTDEKWSSEWTLQFGDMIIGKMPKNAALRFVIYNHLIHHRGQLSVYLRLLDIPVPGLYGPSADDRQG